MAECKYNDDERLYLQMMQANIERMATNSANCKTWLITIIAALVALFSIVQIRNLLLVTFIPILVFWYLDIRYLELEKGMRNRQRHFLNIMRSNKSEDYDLALFNFNPLMCEKDEKEMGMVSTLDAWKSFSIWGLYGFFAVVIVIIFIATV